MVSIESYNTVNVIRCKQNVLQISFMIPYAQIRKIDVYTKLSRHHVLIKEHRFVVKTSLLILIVLSP